MMSNEKKTSQKKNSRINRRDFIAGSAAAVAGFSVMKPSLAKGYGANSRIEVGFVGFGGRGNLIARLITANHKGYQIVSAADYFDDVVQKAGDKFNVAKNRRFSGLNGYKKVIASKVDAMFFETPPCFFPEHVAASVEAGCNTYFAKPIACDVPGCLSILESGKKATKTKQVFLIDYQIPTNEFNIETVKRVHAGQIGKIGMLHTMYYDNGFADPPKTDTIASRLTRLVWVNDIELGGSMIVNCDIHSIDAGMWLAGANPISAMGCSRVTRKHHGNTRDMYSITYQYENGLIHNHVGEHAKNLWSSKIHCHAWGDDGYAEISYWNKAWIRSNKGSYAGGDVKNLYVAGIDSNLDKFEKAVREKNYENDTLQRGVDSALAAILGREAGMRNGMLTMDEMIKENKKYEFDTTGLKA
jgi:myo-inositol 2-dehydrogenase/D-chiro-inositol 1-dehydrogenase